MKRVQIKKKDVADFKAGKKVSAKGKKRRTEIQHDAELEGRMTEHTVKNTKPKREPEIKSEVGTGQIRGVVKETIARCYQEFWPGMETHGAHGEVDIEIAEEGYILTLTMITGNPEDKPRQGLKIKEVEMSDDAPMCKECAA